jgi:hypothetical protein
MKALRVLGVLAFTGCTAAFAGTPNVAKKAPLNVDQFCDAASADAAPQFVEIASAAIVGSKDKLQKIDPNPPVVNDGGGQCPQENQCSCGAPQFDFNDPACSPGVDLGTTHCRSLHCDAGQTVHYRVCPCSSAGCNPVVTWSALFCAAP